MGRPHFSIALLHPRHWLTWLAIGLWWLAVHVLPFRWQMILGGWLGLLAGKLSQHRRMIAQKNIALCFPHLSPEEQAKLYRESMKSIGRGLFDTGIAWFWSKQAINKRIDSIGQEHLQRLQEQNVGVLFIGLHFTSLEISGPGVHKDQHFLIDGVYRPHGNPVYDYIQRKGRERHGPDFKVVPRAEVRSMVKCLRKGRALSYLPDQDYGPKHSIFVPFFGVPTAVVTAPSQLVKMGRAAVLAYRAVRKPDLSGYEVEIFPVEGFGSGDEQQDATLLSEFIEARIKEHPEQYLWVHRRFKTRPDGQRDFYQIGHLPWLKRRRRSRSRTQ